MTLLQKIEFNNISITHLCKLFKLNRTLLSQALHNRKDTYNNHLPVIEKYADEIALINDKYRRL